MNSGITLQDSLEVAAIQLNSQDDPIANLGTVRSLVHDAARRGAKLIVLPENLAYMGPEDGKRAIAQPLEPGKSLFDALSAMALEANAWVIAGGLPEASSDPRRPYNTCALFTPTGSLGGKYRKLHLFDVDLPDGTKISESEANMAGDEPVVVDVDGFKVGLSICYDLRFPELYRRLADLGAEIVVVPAAFTLTTGKDHWHVLLRARAIENQLYVIAPGQWGRHPKGRTTYGKSIVVDPWGEVIAQCSEGEGLCLATVHRGYIAQVRVSLPALLHRRLDGVGNVRAV